MTKPVDVVVRDATIKLGQFIKLANLVDTGGEAKKMIALGEVLVNGEVDTRRGKTLHAGDVVTVAGVSARVATHSGDDFFDEATADDDFDYKKWMDL
ncbi:RNA-binding S4 domain-containing protein [Corynebacterium sp.]|uniref:RNA-binding S4 domain-containing protein n=1 Tax=Corynebacterium sp. TaxID=1720 RepID=UPI0026DC6363|nr:RNA-binding S4 domain-containing protein [Corynebacterium sp.]MDO5077679.1 RNA-binding S4 domain-containing protein [Corynebacterium sp.]